MAQIHRGKNLSKEKLRRMRFSPKSIALFILSVIFFAASVWGIVHIIRQPIIGIETLSDVSIGCMDWVSQTRDSYKTESILIALVILALSFFGLLLSLVLGVLCGAAVYILPPLVCWISFHGILNFFIAPKVRRSNKYAIIRAGVEGEENALNMISTLNDRCHIYTNLVIPYDGKTSETDMIAVTPTGVTIIEVKNLKGTLHGDLADEQLIHRKRRRNGSFTDKVLYNPVRQVSTHVYRLAHYLRAQGISVHVRCCILFVNPELSLSYIGDRTNIRSEKCPIFRANDSAALTAYLYNPAVTPLDTASLNRINAHLTLLL